MDGTYLYVTVPGVGSEIEAGGAGIVVFDVDDNYKFIKRIPMPQVRGPETSKGVYASLKTGLLYANMTNKLIAMNINTDRLAWMQGYDGWCCDRGDISPDETIIYQAAIDESHWYVLEAATGKLITTIDVPARAHNTIFSPKGDRVYMSPAYEYIEVADTKTHKLVGKIGPFSQRARPFTINGKETHLFASVNGLLGVGVADIKTGKVVAEVSVPESLGYKTSPSRGHGSPTHGIAMTHDETEIWIPDSVNGAPGALIHVFDNTVFPPKYKQTIQSARSSGWITCGIDGTRMYPSSGEVIDQKTKKIITTLKDEQGRIVQSEKLLELQFTNDKLSKVGDQWCNGKVGTPQR
jgi:DNA-binding beta-propeller fold protein YncE